MINLILNETPKFSLSKNVENTRLMIIKNRPNISLRPLIDTHEMNDIDWDTVQHTLFHDFNDETDMLLGFHHTEKGTKIYLLDITMIKRKILSKEESAKKREKNKKTKGVKTNE